MIALPRTVPWEWVFNVRIPSVGKIVFLRCSTEDQISQQFFSSTKLKLEGKTNFRKNISKMASSTLTTLFMTFFIIGWINCQEKEYTPVVMWHGMGESKLTFTYLQRKPLNTRLMLSIERRLIYNFLNYIGMELIPIWLSFR